MENIARKLELQINQEKNKIYDSGKVKQIKTKNRIFENKNFTNLKKLNILNT
jgi:hypothetical protein